MDAASRLAALAASRIEDGALSERSMDDLSAELGITSRHLRRVIHSEFGVSPVELAQAQRLLLAKRLLTDTRLPVTEVAYASGFSSLRRFNALFKKRYRLHPSAFRNGQRADTPPQTLRCELGYRPPLDWKALLGFLAARATPGIELIEGGRYWRTLSLRGATGWVLVEPSTRANTLAVEFSASLAPALVAVLAGVKRVFDLAAAPDTIASHLGPLAAERPGLRVPGAWDGFEVAMRAILSQQISIRAATTLASRLAAALGEPIETPHPALTRLAPPAARVAATEEEELISLGVLPARARAIRLLARRVAWGELKLEPGAGVPETMALLQEIPGVGEWTAQYCAMRALAWPDAFPHSDLGIRKALGGITPRQALQRAESWRPWRAYAAMHLWRSLEERT
jgi:AraC family transcriptional regulator of adaptative response / DNA-3-methyladenine glycosylase II